MKLIIKNSAGVQRAVVSPSDNSVHTKAAMGENVLSLSFVSFEYIQFDVNDYVEFEGETYTLMEIYHPTMKSYQEWQYDMSFFGVESELKRALVLKIVDNEFNPVFSLTAQASEHIRLIVDNINRIKNTTDWKVGEVVASENITISYNGTYCYDALTEIANQLNTEWWVDGTTINLTRCEFGNPVILGYKNGLTNLVRDSDEEDIWFFTRLYPIGSSRNIDPARYGFSRLQLPNGQKYVEQNLQFGIIEQFEETAFSGIYPRRTGTISSVRSVQATGQDGNPYTIWYFKDTGLNFDPNNYELPGLVKNIVFQSGELNGRDFEINFNSGTQEFEIITQFPDGFDQLPGGHMVPAAGDEYILYNITMPTEYYQLAEQEFSAAVDAFMEKYMLDKSIYKGDTDYIEVAKRNVPLLVGQRIKLDSTYYFPGVGYRVSRIVSVTRKLNNPAIATLGFSDVIARGRLDNMEADISEAMNYARTSATLPDIIKSWETTRPTDYNLFSALRSLREFLSKNNDDTARGLITFLKGIEIGDFETGMLGSGAAITVDEDGITTAEVDKLIVRRYAKFFELIIERLSHIGGQLIISPARLECSRVEYLPNAYRCYFDTGDNNEFVQEFVARDQARCQVFTGSTMKYYWRLVTGIGGDYIDLSKTDADSGSDIPAAGDHIVQLGNRTNPERQNAQILSSFGEDAPSYKQYAGINSYSLVGKYVTGFTSKGNKITGQVTIEAGSTGWQNLSGLPEEIQKAADIEVGGVNLLRNTGFTGDFQTRQLEAGTQLTPNSELFSERLKYWEGNAQVNSDSASVSGYSCHVFTRLSQSFFKPVIEGERYVISFKAKGNVTVKIGTFTGMKSITGNDFERLVYKFEAVPATAIEFTGDCTICEIQLERGTVATTWSISPYDNPESTAQFEAIRYLSDAIRGKTSILGGLILTTMIQLGVFRNGELEKITSGISGIYNDDDDVAFWAGGTLPDAIRAAMQPHEKVGANAVITHGGRAIFNEAVIRGLIYAEGGEFTGTVNAKDGKFSGSLAEKFNPLPVGETITLNFATGFNFSGKEEFSVNDTPLYTIKNIILPTSKDYNGIHCTIINAGDTSYSRTFDIKTGDNKGFLYPAPFFRINNVSKIRLGGFGLLILRAFIFNDELRWVVSNYNDFTHIFFNNTLSNIQNNSLMRLCSAWEFRSSGFAGAFALSVPDGNNLSWTQLGTGKQKFTFFNSRANSPYNYLVFVSCIGHGYGWISEKTDDYFIVETADDATNNDMNFNMIIIEIKT